MPIEAFNPDDELHSRMSLFAGRDARILWSHEDADELFREMVVVTHDVEREAIMVLRGWQSSKGVPSVSADLEIDGSDLNGPVDLDRYPHGGDSASELDVAFKKEAGGDVAVLWKHEGEGWSAYLARSARIGHAEDLVIGMASVQDNSAVASVAHRSPCEDVFASKTAAYGR